MLLLAFHPAILPAFAPMSPVSSTAAVDREAAEMDLLSLFLYPLKVDASGCSLTEDCKENNPNFVGGGFAEAKVGVNKPDLLPKEFTTVIDVAGFLSDGQEKRLAQEIAAIEKDTGFKLRVLAQNYPDTPGRGLAIKDFWQVDDRTIVFVADPTFGNILNFNVGTLVDLDIPRSFWSRLAGKYGNMFYWKEKGEDASVEAAVMAISNCLREPVGANNCSEVK
ncbi:hypothetical protein RJ639_047336 [Escallonia herrerae]|uniref:TPM domain-containing protein n=1 Tax=Escallonia herrerae TaxID=1293975 RepID=A0AA88W907_9ASTE|nr:hypothetical protein RJ639_047336 [Escallonia herrerae]